MVEEFEIDKPKSIPVRNCSTAIHNPAVLVVVYFSNCVWDRTRITYLLNDLKSIVFYDFGFIGEKLCDSK